VAEALAAVGSPHLLSRSYGGLSVGERQRVALARCLCQAADLLVLDEPLAPLDPEGVATFLELVERLGTPVLLVTHLESHFERPGWRVLALDGGVLHGAA
jgi:ABC-type Mn2+/Zn2+ transport system ATPase subunit